MKGVGMKKKERDEALTLAMEQVRDQAWAERQRQQRRSAKTARKQKPLGVLFSTREEIATHLNRK